jgi:hypothetical protein
LLGTHNNHLKEKNLQELTILFYLIGKMVLGQDNNKNHIMFFFEQKNHIMFDGKNELFCERKLECKPAISISS